MSKFLSHFLLFLFFFSMNTFANKINYGQKYKFCSSYGFESYSCDIEEILLEPSKLVTWSLGNFSSIAPGLKLFLDGNHRTDWITTYPFMSFCEVGYPEARGIQGHCASKGNISIGNDVWIGRDVTIMSGVTIGDGAVIGANSTVAKNVPPYAIFVGNPARLVRYRFNEEAITALLEMRWWDWPIEKIRKNVHLLCSQNIQEFIENNR